jgi:acetylornithine deacetylase
MIDPVVLTRQLIDIPSITGDEFAVGEFLDSKLTGLGFTCTRLDVADRRFNLLARAGGQPTVILTTHIDTVPPFFESREDDEAVYGRGACDAKGIIAAMIAAGVRLVARGRRDFAFLFVVAEETDSVGAKRANEQLASIGSRYLVNGEPTDSTFVRASKGALTCTVRFAGVAAHSAYPERGDSAITKLVAAVADIQSADWGRHDVLGQATVNVGVIRGGEKPNIVPAWAEAEMIFRTVSEPDEVRGKLQSLIARYDGSIVRSHGNPPQMMVVPAGKSSTVVAFNTDVPHLANLGQPLLFGPGSILDAHGTDEKILKRDLLAAVDTYEEIVAQLMDDNAKTR